ncbi:MAG: T9SS type A sorting domain-containing protein [Flavobacteriales bacterium]|nr:T9SS type A sorting domain-containing protein [Flavobacteriales bacterium]MCB9205487.1 T9SS type A sorting domain-containing protein [Flavobacteriales bacterium]
MRTTLTSIFSLLVLPLLAQVTIDQSSFPRPAGYADIGFQASISGVAEPTSGTGQSWDYSALSPTGSFQTDWIDASGDPDYPTALNYREQLLSFQVFDYESRVYEAVDANGWYSQGRVLMDTTYSITAFTGGANDALNFPDQVQEFDGRLNTLKFPMSYQSTWTESYTESTHFNLTVAANNLTNAPGLQKRTYTQTRTVVGEGTLMIPDENGNPSGSLDALLLKVDGRTVLDSFFLGGQLAPAPLLTAFGLTQGSVRNDPDFYVFYVPDFPTTALNINLDAQGAISSVYYRPSAAALANSVGDELSFNALKSYPNPVVSGQVLNIDLSDHNDAATIELMDLAGRQVFATSVSNSSQIARVTIPDNVVAGMYTMVVRNAETQPLSVNKLLVR